MQRAARTADKYLLLCVWYGAHACGVYTLLYLLDTDIARAWNDGGWVAMQNLLVLLVVNALLYTSLFNFTTAQSSKLHDTVHSKDTIFSSPLLVPLGHRHLTPASICKQLSSGRGVVCVTLLASSEDDTEGQPEQATSLSQASSKQCACPNRYAIRVYHCRICSECVKGFDHHCHWLGGDIGQHNHGRFYMYLGSQACICLYTLHQALTAACHAAHTTWSSQHAAVVGFAVLALVAALLALSLLAFHTFLILANWKTHEVVKGALLPHLPGVARNVARRSPFDRGILQNLCNFVFDRQLYDTLLEAAAEGPGDIWENCVYSCC